MSRLARVSIESNSGCCGVQNMIPTPRLAQKDNFDKSSNKKTAKYFTYSHLMCAITILNGNLQMVL
jgi:hypothetical protein